MKIRVTITQQDWDMAMTERGSKAVSTTCPIVRAIEREFNTDAVQVTSSEVSVRFTGEPIHRYRLSQRARKLALDYDYSLPVMLPMTIDLVQLY